MYILEVFDNHLEWITGREKQKYVLHQALYSSGVANGSTNATVSNRTGDVTDILPGRESLCKCNLVKDSRFQIEVLCPSNACNSFIYEEGCRRYVH